MWAIVLRTHRGVHLTTYPPTAGWSAPSVMSPVGLTASRLQAVHEGHRRGCVRLAPPGALGVRHRDHQNMPAGGDTHVGKPRPCHTYHSTVQHCTFSDVAVALCFSVCASRLALSLRLLCVALLPEEGSPRISLPGILPGAL